MGLLFFHQLLLLSVRSIQIERNKKQSTGGIRRRNISIGRDWVRGPKLDRHVQTILTKKLHTLLLPTHLTLEISFFFPSTCLHLYLYLSEFLRRVGPLLGNTLQQESSKRFFVVVSPLLRLLRHTLTRETDAKYIRAGKLKTTDRAGLNKI